MSFEFFEYLLDCRLCEFLFFIWNGIIEVVFDLRFIDLSPFILDHQPGPIPARANISFLSGTLYRIMLILWSSSRAKVGCFWTNFPTTVFDSRRSPLLHMFTSGQSVCSLRNSPHNVQFSVLFSNFNFDDYWTGFFCSFWILINFGI